MKIKNIISIFICTILIINLTINNLKAEKPLYILNAKKLTYKDNNKIIIAEGEAIAKDQFGKEIYSDYIIYDKVNNTIKTKSNSKYKDKQGNEINADDFFYDLNIKKIKAINNVKYKEKVGNIFLFSEFEYFENSSKGFGKNAKGLMTDKSSFESKFAEIDNNSGTMSLKTDTKKLSLINKLKSLFNNENKYTTCENSKGKKNIKEQCPDWSMTSLLTRHDSKKKMIYHNHAFINIKNIPVFYTPYFSHPDPTVKRKSGFMPPSIKNFDYLGQTLKVPYFLAIDDNSDLTITPIFYMNENNIYLAEYRKQNKNSNLYIDTSYTKGYKNINKTDENGSSLERTTGSRNHFFLNYLSNFENFFFDTHNLEINIQRISQKNYLNVNQINTNFIKQDITSLNNSLILDSYKDTQRLKISSNIYENLNDDNSNTKYQYIFPNIEYNNYFNKYNQKFDFSNNVKFINTGGDSKQVTQDNFLSSTSDNLIYENLGLSNVLFSKLSNLNSYNKNISGLKENLNNEFFGTVAIETSLPLIKYSKFKEEILNPKIFTKYSPSAKNNENETKILNYNDLYSIDRTSSSRSQETGASIGYGIDYETIIKNAKNEKFLSGQFGIGQIYQIEKAKNYTINSSLNEKKSNIVGKAKINYKFDIDNKKIYLKKNEDLLTNILNDKQLTLNYDFNLSKNIDKILKSSLSLGYDDFRNSITASYYETHDIGNDQYIEGNYTKKFENYINFLIGGKKNLENNFTENNYIEINYESDCLKIGFNLAKTFYESKDIKADNNLIFFIQLKPFGQPIAPDLTNLINN